MKKLFACLLALMLTLSLTACSLAEQPAAVRLAALKGPTAMGLVQLLDESENGKAANSYDFLLAGSADEITPKLIQGEIDIAAVPVNLASVLYSKTNGALELVAVNALGVLYVVEKGGESIQSLADLKGKTVIPFATSGSSAITGSAAALKKSYPALNWKEGRLLNRVDEKSIRTWLGK